MIQLPNQLNMEEKDSKKSSTNNIVRFTGIGIQLLIIIALFTWLGVWADHRLRHETPWLTAFLSLTGVCTGIWAVLFQIKE